MKERATRETKGDNSRKTDSILGDSRSHTRDATEIDALGKGARGRESGHIDTQDKDVKRHRARTQRAKTYKRARQRHIDTKDTQNEEHPGQIHIDTQKHT